MRHDNGSAGGLSAVDIRAQIERIVASEGFRHAARLVSFLRYVTEEMLAGRGDRIKAYTVGVDALGRSAGFDPAADPIVRVEAVRLRRALTRYYLTAGCDDAVRISLPPGGYVPLVRAGGPGARPQDGRRTAEARDDGAGASTPLSILQECRTNLTAMLAQVGDLRAEVQAARATLAESTRLLALAGRVPGLPMPGKPRPGGRD